MQASHTPPPRNTAAEKGQEQTTETRNSAGQRAHPHGSTPGHGGHTVPNRRRARPGGGTGLPKGQPEVQTPNGDAPGRGVARGQEISPLAGEIRARDRTRRPDNTNAQREQPAG